MNTTPLKLVATSSLVVALYICAAPAAMAQSFVVPHLDPSTIVGTIVGIVSSLTAFYFIFGTLFNLIAGKKSKFQFPGVPQF